MDKRMTIKVSCDEYNVSVSIAEYGEYPVPACHTYTFEKDQLPAFTEAVYGILKKIIEEA